MEQYAATPHSAAMALSVSKVLRSGTVSITDAPQATENSNNFNVNGNNTSIANPFFFL